MDSTKRLRQLFGAAPIAGTDVLLEGQLLVLKQNEKRLSHTEADVHHFRTHHEQQQLHSGPEQPPQQRRRSWDRQKPQQAAQQQQPVLHDERAAQRRTSQKLFVVSSSSKSLGDDSSFSGTGHSASGSTSATTATTATASTDPSLPGQAPFVMSPEGSIGGGSDTAGVAMRAASQVAAAGYSPTDEHAHQQHARQQHQQQQQQHERQHRGMFGLSGLRSMRLGWRRRNSDHSGGNDSGETANSNETLQAGTANAAAASSGAGISARRSFTRLTQRRRLGEGLDWKARHCLLTSECCGLHDALRTHARAGHGICGAV